MGLAGAAGYTAIKNYDTSEDAVQTLEAPKVSWNTVAPDLESVTESSHPDFYDGVVLNDNLSLSDIKTYENHDLAPAGRLQVHSSWDGGESTLDQQTNGQSFLNAINEKLVEWALYELNTVPDARVLTVQYNITENLNAITLIDVEGIPTNIPGPWAEVNFKAVYAKELQPTNFSSDGVSWMLRDFGNHSLINGSLIQSDQIIEGVTLVSPSNIFDLEQHGWVFDSKRIYLGNLTDPMIGDGLTNYTPGQNASRGLDLARERAKEGAWHSGHKRTNLSGEKVSAHIELEHNGFGKANIFAVQQYGVGKFIPSPGLSMNLSVYIDNVSGEIVYPANISTGDGNENILSQAEYEQRRADGWRFENQRELLGSLEVGLETERGFAVNNSKLSRLLAYSRLFEGLNDTDNTTAGYCSLLTDGAGGDIGSDIYVDLQLQRPWYGGELMAWLHLLNESGVWDSGFIYVDYRGGIDPTEADDILLYIPKDYIDSQNRTVEDIEWEIRDAIRRINRGAIDGVIIGAEGEEIEPFLVTPTNSIYRRDGDYQNYPAKTEAFVPYQKLYRITDLVNFEEY